MIGLLIPPLYDCRAEPPPVYDCAPSPCEKKIDKPVCLPKTTLSYSVIIPMQAVSTDVSMFDSLCRNTILDNSKCAELRIRKRGECDVLSTEFITGQTKENVAKIVWSSEFKALDSGAYEADIFYPPSLEPCGHIPIFKRRCNTVIEFYGHDIEYPDSCKTIIPPEQKEVLAECKEC